MTQYLGIDPGQTTGWAIVAGDGSGVIAAGKLRAKKGEHLAELALNALIPHMGLDPRPKHTEAAVETQFVYRNLRSSVATSRTAGFMEGVAVLLGAEVDVWRPQPAEWRKVMGWVNAKSDEAKAKAKEFARLELGWETDCADVAEACCIAEALRRHKGQGHG